MHSSPLMKPAIIFMFVFLISFPGWPQGSNIKIYRIADSSGPKKMLIEKETGKVQLQRGESGDWQNASPGLELLAEDILKLEPYIHLDLRIAGDQDGQLVALPNPIDRGAILRIQKDSDDEAHGIQIHLESGSMSIDWLRQELLLVAYGIRTVIGGTKLAFIIDPENNNRILFLERGAVSFPDHNELKMEPGDIAVLKKGEKPIIAKITPQKQAWLRGIIRYNAEDIWKKGRIPFYRKPLFYVPAAAVLIGSSAYLISTLVNEKDSPLPEPPPLPE